MKWNRLNNIDIKSYKPNLKRNFRSQGYKDKEQRIDFIHS